MMATGFHHGITAQEVTQGIRPMRNSDTSVIGLIAFSSDADPYKYPIDKPALLSGITQQDINQAGTLGTLRPALESIRGITNPTVVVLRISSIIPENIQKLLLATSLLGVTPKILGAPEIDTPMFVAELIKIAKKTRAFVYAHPRDDQGNLLTDKTEIAAYRDNFGDRELMIIDGEWDAPIDPNAIDARDISFLLDLDSKTNFVSLMDEMVRENMAALPS
jgi:phage tail sheath protein FI